ncbi:MAG: hypothetical protein ABI858_00085 [Pseudoxanthomonas sp.]
MTRYLFDPPTTRRTTLAALLITLSACATTPANTEWVVGQQATIEGRVLAVDTAPWAYDGNAILSIATTDAGTVRTQLPARWNLCKAQPLPDLQALKPGDRVQAIGTVNAPGEIVICAQPEHFLRKKQ